MRDRGTNLLGGVPWSAWDGPVFREPCEVFACKGAAVLYRRSMLEALGSWTMAFSVLRGC